MINDNRLGFKNLVIMMVVISLGFLSIIGMHNTFQNISNDLDEQLENKEMEITIGRYILSHLQVIESQFYQIALGKNNAYSELIRKDMEKEIDHLKESFETLKNGGYITHHIELNIVGKDFYEERLYYEPTDELLYNVEAIDLNPKLDQTIEKLEELMVLIREYEAVVDSGDAVEKIKIEREFSNFMKYIPPHFIRMKENANRIIYESKIEADNYRQEILDQKAFSSRTEVFLSIIVFAAILFFGYYFGKGIVTVNSKLTDYAFEAEKANVAKTMFVTNMSHEIRTPLNAIIGFGDILDDSKDLPDQEKEYVEIINRSAKSLLEIVNDILDFSKIESDNLTLDHVSFNTRDLFEEVIELYAIRAHEKDIKLLYNPSYDVPKFVYGDPVKLKQIISNLLTNAIKFTDRNGEVALNVLCSDVDEDEVVLAIQVEDNGIGISDENMDRIFYSFEQAEIGTTRKFGGTGLGLAIAKRFVEAMGGQIEVESTKGMGSTFSFSLKLEVDQPFVSETGNNQWQMTYGVCCRETTCPTMRDRIIYYVKEYGQVVEDFDKTYYDNMSVVFVFYNDDIMVRLKKIKEYYPKVPIVYVGDFSLLNSEEQSYISDVIGEPIYCSKVMKLLSRYYISHVDTSVVSQDVKYSGKVLVAEDNRINQQLIEVLFNKFGLEPIFANNGEEAVHKFKRETPDLVFMDLHMPVMDGLEATKSILQLEEGKERKTPIVALTADALSSVEFYKENNFSDFMTKPVDVQILKDILSKHLLEKTAHITIDKEPHEKKEVQSYNINQVIETLGLDSSDVLFIIEQFYMDLGSQLDGLKQAVGEGDLDSLKRGLHNLKGASANLRFDGAVSLLKEMEEKQQVESIDLVALETYYVATRKVIDEQLSGQ